MRVELFCFCMCFDNSLNLLCVFRRCVLFVSVFVRVDFLLLWYVIKDLFGSGLL